MPKNKNALMRYKILDACFRDRRKRYYIEDLLDKVNETFWDVYGTNISERQIREDIKFMKESHGYDAPIDKKYDGHRVYYSYSDSSFSIMTLPMSEKEMEQLADTLNMLDRFKGLPSFEWIEESLFRFKKEFNLEPVACEVVHFASNPALHGLMHFESLYDSILKKKVLKVSYLYYCGKQQVREVHPYQLRQYNNRWFLVGREISRTRVFDVAVLPLDRIKSFVVAEDRIYQEYEGMDLDEYFKDVVGVSVDIHAHKQKIRLKVEISEAQYIQTKPIHPSQHVVEENDEFVIFEMNLIPNYEFETILLGHLDHTEILEPLSLRKKMQKRVEKIRNNIF